MGKFELNVLYEEPLNKLSLAEVLGGTYSSQNSCSGYCGTNCNSNCDGYNCSGYICSCYLGHISCGCNGSNIL